MRGRPTAEFVVEEGLNLPLGLDVTVENHEAVASFKFSLVTLEGLEQVEHVVVMIHEALEVVWKRLRLMPIWHTKGIPSTLCRQSTDHGADDALKL